MAPNHPSRRRACATCVKAKVRCQTNLRETPCDRCVRLKIRCTLPGSSRQNPDGSLPTRRDRLDHIQQQLDTIIAQLPGRSSSVLPLVDRAAKSARQLDPKIFARDTSTLEDITRTSDGLHLQSLPSARDEEDCFQSLVSDLEGEKLLRKFRSHYMVLFPFVVIPQIATVASLRRDSPFLLLAIYAASQGDIHLQRKLNVEVANVVAKRIIIQNERNIDLLLGLLVHVAWHHYDWQNVHLQMSMYLQVAVAMVADLGLDGETSYIMPAGYSGATRLDKTLLPAANQDSTAGKRAVLGCFYLSSVLSIFRKSLAMRHTPRIREYCESLEGQPECPTDPLLRAFVSGQSLAKVVEERLSQNGRFAWDSLSLSIDEECVRTKAELTPHGLFVNGASHLEFKAMQAFAGVRYLRYLNRSPEAADSESIRAVLASAKSTVTTFLELPQAVVAHLPIPSLVTVWYCMLMVCKLTILAPHGSSTDRDCLGRSQARQFVLAVAEKFRSLSKGDDFWLGATRTMGNLVPWLDERLAGGGTTGAFVVLPHPIDGPRKTDAAQCMTAVERPFENPSATMELPAGAAKYVGGPDGISVASFCAAPLLEGGVEPENGSELYWDEHTWHQMMVDFAIGPGYSSL